MTLKTSLIITGDASGGQAAVRELIADVMGLGQAALGAAAPLSRLDKAQNDAAASARSGAAAATELDAAQKSSATGATAAAEAERAVGVAHQQASAAAKAQTSAAIELAAAQNSAATAGQNWRTPSRRRRPRRSMHRRPSAKAWRRRTQRWP